MSYRGAMKRGQRTSKRGRTTSTLTLVLLIVTIAAIVAACIYARDLARTQDKMILEAENNPIWRILQAEDEARRLRQGIAGFLAVPAREIAIGDEARARLASRAGKLEQDLLALLEAGVGILAVEAIGRDSSVQDLFYSLEQFEAELDGRLLSPRFLRRLDAELQTVGGTLHGLSILVLERHKSEDLEHARTAAESVRSLVAVSLTGLLALLVLVALTILAFRRSERRAAEAALHWSKLENALNTLGHSFSYFDSRDRLQFHNDWYGNLEKLVLRRGMSFEEAVRNGIRAGIYAVPEGQEESWLAERVVAHRNPQGPLEVLLSDGRCMLVDERRTGDGGRAALGIDITEIKRSLESARRDAAQRSYDLQAFRGASQLPLALLNDTLDLLGAQNGQASADVSFDTALESCLLLTAFIGDLVALSDPTPGPFRTEIAEFETARLWSLPIGLLEGKALSRGITLLHEADRDLPPRVRGDCRRISQVILLLLGEAISLNRGGTLSLTLSAALRRGPGATGLALECSLKRNGSEGVWLQAWEGERSEPGRSCPPKIELARRLARAIGGDLRQDPELGLVFEAPISRPLRPALPGPHDLGGSAAERFTRRLVSDHRVLVVEDDRINRRLILAYLERMGVQAEAVGDGTAGLARANEGAFDLILMDLSMPVLDGFAATEAIRSGAGPCRNVPILALTANAKPEDVERCLSSGMNGHIAKPVDPARLAQTLRRWLTVSDSAKPVEIQVTGPDFDEPLNAAALDDLVAGAGGALASELIGDFLTDLDKNMEVLKEAVKARDSATMARICHTIKGSAGLFGASEVSDLAAQIEEEAKHLSRGEAFRLVSELAASFDRSRDAYGAWQSQHSTGLDAIGPESRDGPEGGSPA